MDLCATLHTKRREKKKTQLECFKTTKEHNVFYSLFSNIQVSLNIKDERMKVHL